MSGRPRNIRQKVPVADLPDAEEAPMQIHMRQPKAKPIQVINMSFSEPLATDISSIADRHFEQVDIQDNYDDLEDPFLQKKIDSARAQRRKANFTSLEQEEDDTPHPLSMIADTGIDEEIFEEHRGHSIHFDVFEKKPEMMIDDGNFDLDDEESRNWERAQVRKGISSAGVKTERNTLKATESLFKFKENSTEEKPIDFRTLDAMASELESSIKLLETTLQNQETVARELQVRLQESSLHEQPDIAGTVEKHIFFAELLEYLHSFSRFSREAQQVLSTPEIDVLGVEAFFEEAIEEFSEPSYLFNKMKQWKALYPSEYDVALGSQVLPYLLEVFVHRQLMLIDIFPEGNIPDLNALIDQLADDVEPELRKLLLEQVYSPKLLHILSHHFDPVKSEQAVKLKGWLDVLSQVMGQENRNLRIFRFIIMDKIDEAKQACQSDSDQLRHILKSQSILDF